MEPQPKTVLVKLLGLLHRANNCTRWDGQRTGLYGILRKAAIELLCAESPKSARTAIEAHDWSLCPDSTSVGDIDRKLVETLAILEDVVSSSSDARYWFRSTACGKQIETVVYRDLLRDVPADHLAFRCLSDLVSVLSSARPGKRSWQLSGSADWSDKERGEFAAAIKDAAASW